MQRIARGQFRYVHMWHDHLLAISGASSVTRTRGRALESGQMRTLEPSGVEHRCEVRLGLLLNGSSVMMGPVSRWARHIVHLMADGQFSYVQYSQLHFGWKSVILARTELLNVPFLPSLAPRGHSACQGALFNRNLPAIYVSPLCCVFFVVFLTKLSWNL